MLLAFDLVMTAKNCICVYILKKTEGLLICLTDFNACLQLQDFFPSEIEALY